MKPEILLYEHSTAAAFPVHFISTVCDHTSVWSKTHLKTFYFPHGKFSLVILLLLISRRQSEKVTL